MAGLTLLPTIRWSGSAQGRSSLALFLSGVVVATAAGCSAVTAGLVTGGEWSRSYVLPYERVRTAVVASLSNCGYTIVEDERGRIEAESAADPAYRAVVLIVRVDQREEAVTVDVQASGGGAGAPADNRHLDRAVTEFLDELDDRLRQR